MRPVVLVLCVCCLVGLTSCLSPEEAALRDARRAGEAVQADVARAHAQAQAALAHAQEAAARAAADAEAAQVRVAEAAARVHAEGLAAPAAATSNAAAAWPRADPADVASVDALMAALYDVISGPAGEPRDWARLSSLFHPTEGRLMPAVPRADGSVALRSMTPDAYRQVAEPVFAREGFFERELSRVEERYGDIAHVFSTYETLREVDGEAFQRGINSVQLFWDGSRWWVLGVAWCGETPERPLPPAYLG